MRPKSDQFSSEPDSFVNGRLRVLVRQAGCMQTQWILTGADFQHFANSRMLVASWWDTNRHLPLAYCDFGLTPEQLIEVQSWPVTVLPVPAALAGSTHAWRY